MYYYPEVSYKLFNKIFISVDFPAPFDPTIAILESMSTPKLISLYKILSAEYPKEPSSIFKIGGGIFSGTGKLN